MGRKILDSKILYVILSIFLAIILWFYVSMVQDETQNKPIENIPVTFLGTDVLQERGLMLTRRDAHGQPHGECGPDDSAQTECQYHYADNRRIAALRAGDLHDGL